MYQQGTTMRTQTRKMITGKFMAMSKPLEKWVIKITETSETQEQNSMRFVVSY